MGSGITVALWLAIVFFFFGAIDQASQADIEAACAKNHGVQQIVGTNWVSISGTVTAVCKDGRVKQVK